MSLPPVGPFEIHLTTLLATDQTDAFCAFCRERDWKPLHIVLDQGQTTSQPMATLRGHGDEATARALASRSAVTLQTAGWKLRRALAVK